MMLRSKIVRLFVLPLVVSSMASVAAAANVTVSVNPASQTIPVGSGATVEIRLNTNGLDVGSCQGRVSYDTAPMTYNSGASSADSATWSFFSTLSEPTSGTIQFGVARMSPVNGASVLIATLQFNTGAAGTSNLTLLTSAPAVQCFAADLSTPLTTAVANGSVTVQGLPTNTPTDTPTFTDTATSTATNTPTNTFTRTATPSDTATNTVTNTATATNTPTSTFTATSTPVNTATNTSTLTNTATNTPTNTFTRTDTPTGTPTETSTFTNTPTETFTATSTPTNTYTRTDTPTRTPTETSTFTDTPTETFTATSTPTSTGTATDTATDTPVNVPTDTPTNVDTPTPTPTSETAVCAATPLMNCRATGKGLLKLQGNSDATRQKLIWKWTKGSTQLSEFGDPIAGATNYRLCIYDDGVLKMSPAIAGGGTCDGNPCWSTSGGTGLKFKSKLGGTEGITQVKFKAGVDKAKVQVKGRGAGLVLPFPINDAAAVTVQLVKNPASGPECWETVLATPAKKNDAGKLKFLDKLP